MIHSIVLNIQVTEEDIAKGVQHECHLCPVALAINRAFHLRGYANMMCEVYPVSIIISQWTGKPFSSSLKINMNCDTPKVARAFLVAFDGWVAVKPFEFLLFLP